MANANSRRQFLRNTALSSLGLGLLPTVTSAKPASPQSLACDKTTPDYYGLGPFYTANAPEINDNKLAADNEAGTRLIISGQVRTLDCTELIPNAVIDIWQANDAGQYDNSGFTLRGITHSNAQGFYLFETILPGKYLNGSQYRPRHIHFKITAPGFPAVVTQLYFEGDTDIPADAAASITSGTYDARHRIIPITKNAQDEYEGTWDIVINGDGTNGSGDLHLEKGIIYSVSPNPFIDKLNIRYGIFEASKVSLQVFDIKGALVAILDEKELNPEKYQATWIPKADLQNGVYFVALKLNDMQVHYLKVVKALGYY